MRSSRWMGGLCAAAITLAAGVAVAQPAGDGYGWMGPGMMYGGGPNGGDGGGYGQGGYGWMGPGMMYGGGPGGGAGGGYGWMGPGMMWGYGGGYGRGGWRAGPPANLNLTVPQVQDRMQRWLAAGGNPHIKLGPVVAKDGDTITADIVTTDKDALVERFDINRHTGFMQPEN